MPLHNIIASSFQDYIFQILCIKRHGSPAISLLRQRSYFKYTVNIFFSEAILERIVLAEHNRVYQMTKLENISLYFVGTYF